MSAAEESEADVGRGCRCRISAAVPAPNPPLPRRGAAVDSLFLEVNHEHEPAKGPHRDRPRRALEPPLSPSSWPAGLVPRPVSLTPGRLAKDLPVTVVTGFFLHSEPLARRGGRTAPHDPQARAP